MELSQPCLLPRQQVFKDLDAAAAKEDVDHDQPPATKKSRREMMCEQCNDSQSKYTCPKCAFRSCCVACVKQHKLDRLCDGLPQRWTAVAKYSEYNPNTSVRDQEFLSEVKEKVKDGNSEGKGQKTEEKQVEVKSQVKEAQPHFPHPVYQLLKNCRMKRVWLNIKDAADVGSSRHENFSDTIFWDVKVTFARSSKWDWQTAMKKIGESSNKASTGPSLPELEGNDDKATKSASESTSTTSSEALKVSESKVITQQSAITGIVPNYESDVEDGELASDNEGEDIQGKNEDQSTGSVDKPEETAFKLEETSDKPEESLNHSESQIPDSELTKEDLEELPLIEDVIPEVVEDSELEVYSYTVTNIPETLTVRTLIRQFVRPKTYGPLISKGDLDQIKMEPFTQNPDNLVVYMPVVIKDQTKYYGIDVNKSFTDNLRNKFLTERPEFIVLLNKDPKEMVKLSEGEVEELHQERKTNCNRDSSPQKRRPMNNNRGNSNKFNNNRWNNRDNNHGGRDFNRPQRNQNHHQNRGPKRNYYNNRDDLLENILAAGRITDRDVKAMTRY
ncbi:unnamed protein product [Bursaphelenchus okinawaensis]|uniref:HIT-type domain-containing protein n=1 Tax=Bursaphelenchus okinawaensis TaxID=465554 RepID=A0A811LDS7_9BILA|nr:unnamed protein product [Bursaphelenchus okinawaensis]CAG9120812.1 unnamed protein product [Bursaphelenchus okinawaensis]